MLTPYRYSHDSCFGVKSKMPPVGSQVEVLVRYWSLSGKTVLDVLKATGLKSGVESATHAMNDLYDEFSGDALSGDNRHIFYSVHSWLRHAKATKCGLLWQALLCCKSCSSWTLGFNPKPSLQNHSQNKRMSHSQYKRWPGHVWMLPSRSERVWPRVALPLLDKKAPP